MKVKEGALIKQVIESNKTINKMKKTIKETQNKAKSWEEVRLWLDMTITLACKNFVDTCITNEMFAEAKVIHLGEITKDLCKIVTELKAQVTLSRPLEVLDEIRKTAKEATTKIKEVEALCAKEFEQFSQMWEALINDEEL